MAEAATEQQVLPTTNTFCWTEIATTNIETTKNFYKNVFGWETKNSEVPMEGFVYQEYSLPNGIPMGGIFEMQAEMYGGEMPPPHFMNYIAVENIDEMTSKVFDLNGKIVSPPMDIPNVGRFSVVEDLTGAVFSLITLKETYPPSPLSSNPGELTWYELNTKDIEKSKNFYQEFLGWEVNPSEHNKDYSNISINGVCFGGMLQITQDWGEGWENIPSHWLNYVAVADCDETVGKIKENGGNICIDNFVIENVGKMAVASDQAGAVFSIIQMAK